MNPLNKIYQITLRPLSRFFFGGEIVFGGDGAQDERNRSYLVHSRVLPQQTSLLGMLREELLRQNDRLLDKNSDPGKIQDAKDLVGRSGFGLHFFPDDPNEQTTDTGFGMIQALSPLCLVDDKETQFQPAPADDVEGKDGKTADYDQESTRIFLRNFDAKSGLASDFSTATGVSKALDKFFSQEAQVGITVTNRHLWRVGEPDNEAFYRQTFFKNANSKVFPYEVYQENKFPERNNYAFRFWVEMTDPPPDFQSLKDSVVQMGGERSTFKMEVKVETTGTVNSFDDKFHDIIYNHPKSLPSGYHRCLLISDTYLPRETLTGLKAVVIGETIPFRFFSTIIGKTENYFDLKRGDMTKRRQSGQFSLLRRGTVIYVPDSHASYDDPLDQLTSEIKNQSAFRNIGYNYFKTQK
ncbi:MAG TPA: type III-B CRISPR module-associated Cmr3 family protein [Flavilitoribacter sp.]|nr:type III-B CRISPR module-associated Cmr3 family protein [Flavilitoribacter sp.]